MLTPLRPFYRIICCGGQIGGQKHSRTTPLADYATGKAIQAAKSIVPGLGGRQSPPSGGRSRLQRSAEPHAAHVCDEHQRRFQVWRVSRPPQSPCPETRTSPCLQPNRSRSGRQKARQHRRRWLLSAQFYALSFSRRNTVTKPRCRSLNKGGGNLYHSGRACTSIRIKGDECRLLNADRLIETKTSHPLSVS